MKVFLPLLCYMWDHGDLDNSQFPSCEQSDGTMMSDTQNVFLENIGTNLLLQNLSGGNAVGYLNGVRSNSCTSNIVKNVGEIVENINGTVL